MATAAQKKVQNAMRKASKQASREGKKGKAYKSRVKTLFNQYYKGGGGSKKKASSSSKKKKSGGKKKTYTKKAGGNVSKSKKFSQSDVMMSLSVGGPAIQKGLVYAETGDIARITQDIPIMYAGYDPLSRTFQPQEMVRGYAGMGNEILRRKIFRMTGTTAMPTKGSVLEHGVYYAKAILNVLENQNDLQAAHLQFHKDYFGVDLKAHGMDAWQPGEMSDTALPLWLVKQGKKLIRGSGYGRYIPKWM